MKTSRMAFGAFAIVLLSTAAHAEIVLNCHGTQISFGPTRGNNVTEEITDFGFIVDLESKEVRWTTKFVGDGRLPITVAGDTEISFGDKDWYNDNHYTEFGKLNRVTGDLEYLSETTWDKSNRDRNTKAGDRFGDQWKMKCAPGRRIF
jgi:hypothetical protein